MTKEKIAIAILAVLLVAVLIVPAIARQSHLYGGQHPRMRYNLCRIMKHEKTLHFKSLDCKWEQR